MKLVDNVIKADATLGVKVEPYDDTELRERVEALEEKPDKDTIYDDTALTERVTALENKPDKDTVYDDTAIKEMVQAKQDATPSSALTDPAGTGIQLVANQKIDYDKLADAIIAKYQGQTLAGKAQSVKSALDTVRSVQDQIIKTEDSSTPCSYSAGDFFVYDGKLYKASADFSSVTLTDENVGQYAEVQTQAAVNLVRGSGGEDYDIEETLLEEGSFTPDKLMSSYETGITLGELRKYKYIMVWIRPSKFLTYYYGITTSDGECIVMPATNNGNGVRILFWWVNPQKTVCQAFCVYGSGTGAMTIFPLYNTGVRSIGGESITNLGRAIGKDTEKIRIYIHTNGAEFVTVNYKIRAALKYI